MTFLTSLPIQIALGITLAIVGCCLAYQFGDWLNCTCKHWKWRFSEKKREEQRKLSRIVDLLELILKEKHK